jgi:hypothetical protein
MLPAAYRQFLVAVGLFGAGDFAHTLLILLATQKLIPMFGATNGKDRAEPSRARARAPARAQRTFGQIWTEGLRWANNEGINLSDGVAILQSLAAEEDGFIEPPNPLRARIRAAQVAPSRGS